jgi:hypothetical protein
LLGGARLSRPKWLAKQERQSRRSRPFTSADRIDRHRHRHEFGAVTAWWWRWLRRIGRAGPAGGG